MRSLRVEVSALDSFALTKLLRFVASAMVNFESILAFIALVSGKLVLRLYKVTYAVALSAILILSLIRLESQLVSLLIRLLNILLVSNKFNFPSTRVLSVFAALKLYFKSNAVC